jgi:hypothetical protein
MSRARTATTFNRATFAAVVKAAKKEGLPLVRTTVAPDGTISVYHLADPRAQEADDPYDAWKAANGSR